MNVFVVDDEAAIRNALVHLLGLEPELTTITPFPDAESMFQGLAKAAPVPVPDAVLMDLEMPGMGGLAATQRLREQHPSLPVVVLTHLADDASVFAALRAGAVGYVTKDSPARRVIQALMAAQRGEASLDAALARRVVEEFRRLSERVHHQQTLFETLSRREFEILTRLVEGHGNRAIAEEFSLSERTVKNHVGAVLAKLHVNDRQSAAQIGRAHGLGRSAPE